MTMTFDDLLAPIGAEVFQKEYLGKKPLHLEGDPDKFRSIMSWSIINDLLSIGSIWTTSSLMMVLDKEPVANEAYAAPAVGRDGGQVMRPDPLKVQQYLKRGATLVANDIDQLRTPLNMLSRSMEEALGAKVQSNLYLSSKRKQGFRAHFDTHDVYAVHVEGEKVWHVFEGRAEDPIAHPMFKNLSQDHHEKAKGKLWKEVRLKPGDLLYLPRGQYHYALADDGGCMHVAMGITYPIGIDVVSYMFERLIGDPLCRRNLPRDPGDLSAHLAALGDRIADVLREPTSLADIQRFQKGFRYQREEFDLPTILDPKELRFSVQNRGIRLVEKGGRFGLMRDGSKQAVEVPKQVKDMVAWVLRRQAFQRTELDNAFQSQPRGKLDKFLEDMQNMALIKIAA